MTEMTNDSMGKHTGIGEVQIANEVVASIAGISASEVEGVDSMAGGLAGELAGKFGAKNLSKGVKVEVETRWRWVKALADTAFQKPVNRYRKK